mgnify:CR=1 FL=1
MKTGLVLEGGAMRGMYTAGALDVLLENDINFDGIIGTSAGAVFGVISCQGRTAGSSATTAASTATGTTWG